MKNFKSTKPCVACGKFQENFTVLHHLYAKAAYPEHKYKPWNLMPLCSIPCHRLIHDKGRQWMAIKFSGVKKFLIDNQWYFDEFKKAWEHDKNE